MTGIAAGAVIMAGAIFGWPAVPVVALILLVKCAVGNLSRLALLGLVSLGLLGALRSVPDPASTLLQFAEIPGPMAVQVASPPLQSGDRIRFDAEVMTGTDGSPGTVCATAPGDSVPSVGDSILLDGSLVSLQELPLNRAAAYAHRGCQGFISADDVLVVAHGHGVRTWLDGWRRQLIDALQTGAPGDNGALMSGLVTGDDGALSFYTRSQFALTGTSHVTAVSGSNFAIIIVVATWLASQFGFRRNWPYVLATVLLVWVYAITVGMGAPPFRAALFATLAVIGRQVGRKPDFVTIGLMAGAMQLLLRPQDAWQLGFQLSWVSTMALVLVLEGRTGGTKLGIFKRVAMACIAAQLATLPIILATFGTISLAAFPANLLISPLVAVAFPLSLVAGFVSIVSPAIGQPLIDAAAYFTTGVLDVVNRGASLPWAQITVDSAEPILIWLVAAVVLLVLSLISRDSRNAWSNATSRWRDLPHADRQTAMAMISCFVVVAGVGRCL